MPFVLGRVLPDSTRGSFTWRVEDIFSHIQELDDDSIESRTFSALDATWRFRIDPSVKVDGSSRTRLSLWIYSPVIARFEFGIRGRNDAELIAYTGDTRDKANDGLVGLVELPAQWRKKKEKFAPGGVLSVFCRLGGLEAPRRLSATPGNDTSTQTQDIDQVSQDYVEGPSKSCSSLGALKLAENLKELLSRAEACDVTLNVQNQEFKAHKALLVARSSVFRAMFCHEMSEKLSNEVTITDCDPDAFRIFLKHVYTGDAEGLSVTNAFNVLFVANKYDDADLKIQCKDCIASNITVETVCDIVAYSLLHNDSVLLELASEFFAKNFSQILLTNEWQCFFREHATVANELLIRVSKFYIPPQ